MVYAVDIWEEGLQFLRSRTKSRQNIELICRSAEDVELPSGSLDKVFCFATLHELAHPEGALRRWVSFLKENGRFYFKDPEIPSEQVGKLARASCKRRAKSREFPSLPREGKAR